MAYAIKWDEAGKKIYETGVSQCVLYVQKDNGEYDTGVAWNGISAISENPSGGDENKIYADNAKYLSLFAAEDFGATIEAYTYPDEFEICDGSREIIPGVKIGQQQRRGFGFTFRTELGNDIAGTDYGYILHIVYNAKAEPSERSYQTINDSPDAINFSWTVSTTPEAVEGFSGKSAQVKIDSTKVAKACLEEIENLLYGNDGTAEGSQASEPTLPTMSELMVILKKYKSQG